MVLESGPNLIRQLTPRNRKKGEGREKVMGFRTRDDACRRPGREVKKNENGFNEYRNAANRALLSGVPAHLIPRHIPHCPYVAPAVFDPAESSIFLSRRDLRRHLQHSHFSVFRSQSLCPLCLSHKCG